MFFAGGTGREPGAAGCLCGREACRDESGVASGSDVRGPRRDGPGEGAVVSGMHEPVADADVAA
jgi:hypothetical protein